MPTTKKGRMAHALGLFLLCLALPASAAERPNVLLILVDDMRFDAMSNAGHPYLKTPNLDQLAADGVVFDRAYVTSPLCGPSRASIFTGNLPSRHRGGVSGLSASRTAVG